MKLSRKAARLIGIPIGVLAALLALALAPTRAGERLELATLDVRMSLRGEQPLDARIVVVDVDDEALKLLGWPLPRGFYAQALSVAHGHGAKAVGFDVLFLEETDPAQDALLARAAQACGCAVFPAQLSFDAALAPVGVEKPIAALAAATARPAHVQLDNGVDGVFRAAVTTVPFGPDVFSPLAAALVDVAGLKPPSAAHAGARAHLGWRSARAADLKAHTLLDVLAAAEAEAQGQKPALDLKQIFDGAIVLVGQSAKSVGDRGAVPTSPDAPLVLVHANYLDNLLNDRLLPPPSFAATAALALLLAIAVGLIVTISPALPGALGALAVVLVGCVVGHVMLVRAGAWWPLGVPLVAAALSFVLASVANVAVRDASERQLKRLFSRYVAPHVLEQVMKNPDAVDIRGHKRQLTLLFSDIKGYTTLSNTLPPDQIVELLCTYLDTMVGILLEHEGTVDKIMGDGIMAFFGDPITREDHALRCVKAALAMQRATQRLGERWVERGLSPLQVRIGIATGEVFVGTIGSRDHLEYTAIGRPVNLASRLEGKAPPGGVLVSKETWQLIEPHVEGREVRGLDLKGYSSGYDAWQVLGLKGEVTAASAAELREAPRRPFFSDVALVVNGVTLQATSMDVSPGGMFIVCDTLPPRGARVTMHGKLQRGGAVRIDAVVAHVREGKPGVAGVGLMFSSVFADDRDAILVLLAGVLGEDAVEEQRVEELKERDEQDSRFRYRIERVEVADGIES